MSFSSGCFLCHDGHPGAANGKVDGTHTLLMKESAGFSAKEDFVSGPANVATYHKEARVKQHLFIPDHRQGHLLGSRKSINHDSAQLLPVPPFCGSIPALSSRNSAGEFGIKQNKVQLY